MATAPDLKSCTAFVGDALLASGAPVDVALAIRAAIDAGRSHILAFDDLTGRQVDFDLRGSDDDIRRRLVPATETPPKPARGRPKLGVVAREVTLLPRHWDWLAQQPGGASGALRRLVDEARRADLTTADSRMAQEAAYRVMSVLGGDRPGFEEASRALFAHDLTRVRQIVGGWPEDVATYVVARLPEPSDQA